MGRRRRSKDSTFGGFEDVRLVHVLVNLQTYSRKNHHTAIFGDNRAPGPGSACTRYDQVLTVGSCLDGLVGSTAGIFISLNIGIEYFDVSNTCMYSTCNKTSLHRRMIQYPPFQPEMSSAQPAEGSCTRVS